MEDKGTHQTWRKHSNHQGQAHSKKGKQGSTTHSKEKLTLKKKEKENSASATITLMSIFL